VLLQNSILARNDADVPGQIAPSDCTALVTSLGNNLIGNRTFTGCTITLQPTDLTGDPGLGTFTDNGTPGNGHFPLLSSSQAIDAGNNAVCFRGTNWGGGAWVPVTSGRLPSKIRTTISTKRTLWLLFSEEAFCYRATNSPWLSEFPILLKQALEIIFHSHVVCFVEFARQSIRPVSC